MVERKVDEKMIVQLLMERGIHLDHIEDIITWWQKENELCVQTGKGFLIIEKLQLEGKKEIASEEFIRGYPGFIGTILS